jgi:hypothetical protein
MKSKRSSSSHQFGDDDDDDDDDDYYDSEALMGFGQMRADDSEPSGRC